MCFSLVVSFAIAASHVIKGVHPAFETNQRVRRSDSTGSSGYSSGLTGASLESSSGFGGASSSSASDASSGTIVDPHWWSPYSKYSGRKIPQIFQRHTIVVSEYREFIKRIEAAKKTLNSDDQITANILQSANFYLSDFLALFDQPFNDWRDFNLQEQNPHALSLAGTWYEQDRLNLIKKEEIFARLLRDRHP
ncbi:uncharacterized protein UTRI_04874 [Ustilago trichophora]|uniref:Uncharacterized protein n=1 Tax=Ustilago trichophora TaxID=86804 RepID=A0A5C3EFK2_9BASI|nr:uncharacterized protein UTRI_04874 [Ustilago trichophora]